MRFEVQESMTATAHRALDANRHYGLTVPHRGMFPAGYLWDIAVIAKGIAVDDPERAATELLRFLEAQWATGMLPNEAYFERHRVRERLFGRHPHSPDGITTSGITQPPMIVRSVLEVGRRLAPAARDSFFRTAFPRLSLLCRWVLEQRVGRNGLAVMIHPYETGMDNRIDLAELMAHEWRGADAPLPRAGRAAALTALTTIRHTVGDCRTVPLSHRSSNADLLAAYQQTRHIRRLGYDLAAIEDSGRGLLVEDVGYNAVLVDAFSCLVEMADECRGSAGRRPTVETEQRIAMDRVRDSLEGLWFEDPSGRRSGYFTRNYRTGELCLRPTVAGLFPLLHVRDAGRVAQLTSTLTDPSAYWTKVAPPSAPVSSDGFSPTQYWRGAAWPFPVDILETGLLNCGEPVIAAELRRKYLSRPHGIDHAEYENPLTGEPLGARPFSPSAALSLRFAAA